jgi:hypothetical protein
MSEMTPEPDSTGGENKTKRIHEMHFLFLNKVRKKNT